MTEHLSNKDLCILIVYAIFRSHFHRGLEDMAETVPEMKAEMEAYIESERQER